MTLPMAVSVMSFTGTVTLDNQDQQAWFGYTTGPGEDASILMVRDPSPGGILTPADIAAMWQFYSDIGLASGSARTVGGHTGYGPGGTQPLLFVVRG
nr:hypothetical protein [Sphingomonas sp. Y57]